MPFRELFIIAGLSTVGMLSAACSEDPAKPSCEGEECDNADDAVEDDGDGDDEGGDKSPLDGGRNNPRRDGGTGTGMQTQGLSLPCDVKPLVTKYCGECHGERPRFNAPMSLVTAADFKKATAEGVKARVGAKDPSAAMPPVSAIKPTAEEKATLMAWLDEGAPGSDEKCTSAPPPGGSDGGTGAGGGDGGTGGDMAGGGRPPATDAELECHKLLAHSGNGTGEFNVGGARDAYFNMTFAAPWKDTLYGVVLRPVIGNDQVIHHWLLFQDDVPGIPNAITSSIGAHPSGQLIHGWAPGGETLDLRVNGVDVGLEMPGNATYTMEFHYNSSDPFAKDASGVEICGVKRKTENVAGVAWLGNDQLLIPSAKWTGVCRPLSQEPINIVAVVPHMHKQGKHMKGTIHRKDGTDEILHDEPFDFEYQRLYTKNTVLQPGESITTECTFAQPMSFGTRTDDEMCYMFTVHYPAGALAGLDLWGTFAHGGSSCLGQ